MVTCRCEVLNHLTGDVAVDYAHQHLEQTTSNGRGRAFYRCPDTGVGWVAEQAPSGYGDDQRRLRRTDRT